MSDGASAIIAVIVLSGLVIYFGWFFRRSKSVLEHWAARSRFQIVHSELRWLFQGPFTGWSCKGQTVYRVKVRDSRGQERLGWVLCGGIWAGLLSDQVRVEWDETQTGASKAGNQRAIIILVACVILFLTATLVSERTFKWILNGFAVGCLVFALYCIFQIERSDLRLDKSRKQAEIWKSKIRSVADTTESPDKDLTFDEFCEFEDDKILDEVVTELERMPSGQRHLKKAYEIVTRRTSKTTT